MNLPYKLVGLDPEGAWVDLGFGRQSELLEFIRLAATELRRNPERACLLTPCNTLVNAAAFDIIKAVPNFGSTL